MQQQLEADIIKALRSGERKEVGTLRMLKSALHNAEISKGATLDESEAVRVVRKEAKQRRESIDSYEAAGRADQAQVEQEELNIIERYLPQELDDDDLSQLVKTAIEEVDASSTGDIGKVMKSLQSKVEGRADGGRVAAEVRSQLS